MSSHSGFSRLSWNPPRYHQSKSAALIRGRQIPCIRPKASRRRSLSMDVAWLILKESTWTYAFDTLQTKTSYQLSKQSPWYLGIRKYSCMSSLENQCPKRQTYPAWNTAHNSWKGRKFRIAVLISMCLRWPCFTIMGSTIFRDSSEVVGVYLHGKTECTLWILRKHFTAHLALNVSVVISSVHSMVCINVFDGATLCSKILDICPVVPLWAINDPFWSIASHFSESGRNFTCMEIYGKHGSMLGWHQLAQALWQACAVLVNKNNISGICKHLGPVWSCVSATNEKNGIIMNKTIPTCTRANDCRHPKPTFTQIGAHTYNLYKQCTFQPCSMSFQNACILWDGPPWRASLCICHCSEVIFSHTGDSMHHRTPGLLWYANGCISEVFSLWSSPILAISTSQCNFRTPRVESDRVVQQQNHHLLSRAESRAYHLYSMPYVLDSL